MTGVFIFAAGAIFGACFGVIVAALMTAASREDRSREERRIECFTCPAEDCIGCEDTGCIMHPGDDE